MPRHLVATFCLCLSKNILTIEVSHKKTSRQKGSNISFILKQTHSQTTSVNKIAISLEMYGTGGAPQQFHISTSCLQLRDYPGRWMEINRFNIDSPVRQCSVYTVNQISGELGTSDKDS